MVPHRALSRLTCLAAVLALGACSHLPFGLNRPERPKVASSIYEHAPASAWQRYATGRPATPTLDFSKELAGPTRCVAVPRGMSAVLPIEGGESVIMMPSYGFGVAGEPVTAARTLLAGDGLGLAKEAMARTANVSTHGQACSLDLFAYISFAGPKLQPVVVR